MFPHDIPLRPRNQLLLKADFIERNFSYNSYFSTEPSRVIGYQNDLQKLLTVLLRLPEAFIASRSATLLIDI